MTPRQRVEAALLGHEADQVPFTAYFNKYFPSRVERELRNEGFCIVESYRIQPFVVETPDVSETIVFYRGKDNLRRIRRELRTPIGSISSVDKELPDHPMIPGQFLPWHDEYLFKGPDDYKAILFMIRNRRYSPNYEVVLRAQEDTGGDVFLFPDIGYSPIQEIIINIMGLEQFSIEWHERRDEVLALYEALTEDRRKFYPLVAESPLLIVNYGGNVSPEVLGLQRFEQYDLPHYDELAEMMHAHGKLLSVHFDANTRLLASAIANSKIDCIEAFTPFPNSDMSLSEARTIWQGKTLWINFPSAAHLEEPSKVKEITRHLLKEAVPGDRFIIGITETVPIDKWQQSFSSISHVINTEGRLPLNF
jgi:hypothetical protein